MRSRAERPTGGAALGAAAVAVLALSLPGGAGGQAAGEDVGRAGAEVSLPERSDRLYFDGKAEAALSVLAPAIDSAEAAYPLLWRGARASLALALTTGDSDEETRRLRRAAAFGRRAVAAREEGADGHYWLAAAAGLLAVRSPEGESIVELGREARHHARRTLEIQPWHGGAHNVLGRVHYQVMELSAWKRWLAGFLGAGDVVDGTSWEQAERHLREAVARSPEVIYYRLDLARLLTARERDGEAARVLRELLDVPTLHPFDPVLKERARGLLARLGEETRQPSP